MLVLERKIGESVTIVVAGVRLTINVPSIYAWQGSSPRVKLAFDAPANVHIRRSELEDAHPMNRLLDLENRISLLKRQRDSAWTRGEVDVYHRLGHEITELRLQLSESQARLGLSNQPSPPSVPTNT